MEPYLDLVAQIYRHGVERGDRTGTGTKSIFGPQMRFDLADGFPLLTAKKTHFRSVVHELIWLISGETNIKYLTDNDVHIWDDWADENGDLGPVYGEQWRAFRGESYSEATGRNELVPVKKVDQLANVIEGIKTNPEGRRHIVMAWNPLVIEQMALPPCHMFFQFYVSAGKLSLHMYQRSADMFLGVPFNIASYALLLSMVAQVTALEPGELIISFGDAHLYLNHMEQTRELMRRWDVPPLPTLVLNPLVDSIDDFTFSDVKIEGYNPRPFIRAEISV